MLLNDAIPNVQVSWVKMGRRMSQLCLRSGANDFGGTLMEESISRLAGSTEGQMIWPHEFRSLIREINRIPAERSTGYEILRTWEDRAPRSSRANSLPPPERSGPRRPRACKATPVSRDPSSRTRVLLTGGTGGAKLVLGFHEETAPEDLVVVCNTGDDSVVHGLHVSPDVDTIVYTLAGLIDPARGWGVRDDTFTMLDQLRQLGNETWFRLGDRDIATHLTRTRLMAEGRPLSQVVAALCRALGVESTVLPMSDQRVETRLSTPDGEISFQEYFVKARWQPEVLRLRYRGIEDSRPAPGLLEAICGAALVVVCPSNPATSIGPILAVPGVRQALRDTPAQVAAVSPLVRGRPYSGPAHKLMATLGVEASVTGLASAYRDFVDVLVIDEGDRDLRPAIEQFGVDVRATSIRMDGLDDKKRLAGELLELLGPRDAGH